MADSSSPRDLSRTLDQATTTGDREQLGDSLYGELHRLAELRMKHLPAGQTLQPTALVHEVWLRLRGDAEDLRRKRLYFAAAARSMRDILVEQARANGRLKRGGGQPAAGHTALTLQPGSDGLALDDMLALHEALARLERTDARKAEVVLLRFFGGLQHGEIAVLLDITERTVERDWRFAKAWLRTELTADDEGTE